MTTPANILALYEYEVLCYLRLNRRDMKTQPSTIEGRIHNDHTSRDCIYIASGNAYICV